SEAISRFAMFGRIARGVRSHAMLGTSVTSCGVALGRYNSQSPTLLDTKKVDASEFLYVPLSKDKTPADSIEFDKTAPMKDRMKAMIFRVQDEICAGMEDIDGTKFRQDEWERPGHGGGGRSRVIQDGNVFEKGGVNVSVIHGELGKAAATQMRAQGRDLAAEKSLPFFACGVSLVLHPRNPMAPTMHLNYRYFEVETGKLDAEGKPKKLSWFGGGADLTPAYLFEEDARHFHAVYKFGLNVPGSRIESIMMSLPLTARWEYMHAPKAGSWEARTLEVLKNPVDWLDVDAVNLETLSTKELLAEIARRSEKQ
ncbi:hypothetical protein DYB32_001139, partial [Aphanomyces invadans]